MKPNTVDDILSLITILETGCWSLPHRPRPNGYVQFNLKGKPHYAHRVIYERLIGPVPKGLVLDHLCRNSACCNPDHIEPVTQAENVRRSLAGRHNLLKTHCPQGHPYEGDNVLRTAKGSRICRECHRHYGLLSSRKRRAK